MRPVDLFTLRNVEDLVWDHLGEPGGILDLGCGRGSKTESFRRARFSSFGMDSDLGRSVEAREAFPESRFLVGNNERLPFRSESLSAVFSLSTLQYVEAGAVVGEAWRILRPGGRGVFIENLAGNPFARVYRALHRGSPRGHLRLDGVASLFGRFSAVEVLPFNLLTSGLMAIGLAHEALTRAPEIRVAPVRAYGVLKGWDDRLLGRCPGLRGGCWSVLVRVVR